MSNFDKKTREKLAEKKATHTFVMETKKEWG